MINRPSHAAALLAALSIAVSTTTLPVLAKSRAVQAAAPVATAQLAAPRLFVRGTTQLFNPDGLVVTQNYVYVVWQGQSDHLPGPSTIVKYDHSGNIVGSVAINGRCDGLRLNPVTKKLWAVFNNDGLNGRPKRQPLLYTIDPKTLVTNLYLFPPTQLHGGGYDDIAFVNGQAYLAASSPTLTAAGVNDKPVVVAATLTASGTVKIVPILRGNDSGYNVNTRTFGPLNVTDPDSLAVDADNDLVVVGDNDQEVIVIRNPGSAGSQRALRYGFGTQFDDVAWSSGTSGKLWIADGAQNAVYTVDATFPLGTIFVEGPSGIPVQSFIGTAAIGEVVTPLLTQRDGIFSPSVLVFVPAGGSTDGI